MTSLLLTLLYFFAFVAVFVSEKLPEDRKKCEYRTILIESTNVTEFSYTWIIPKDKWHIYYEQCDKKRRPRRTLKVLPSKDYFPGILDDKKYKGVMKDDATFLRTIQLLLIDKTMDRPLVNEIMESSNHNKTYDLIVRNVSHAQCVGNRDDKMKFIKITYQLMQPEELRIWRCEDVGRMVDGNYEFYNLSPAWMVEDDEGRTYKINLHKCHESKLCQRDVLPDVKVWYNATCSVNNVNSCQLTKVQPQTSRAAFIRRLPRGIVIYGKYSTYKEHQNEIGIDSPGLYFFGFDKNDTVIIE